MRPGAHRLRTTACLDTRVRWQNGCRHARVRRIHYVALALLALTNAAMLALVVKSLAIDTPYTGPSLRPVTPPLLNRAWQRPGVRV